MNPVDLDTLAEYSSPLVRDDRTLITITRPDLESNSYLSQLFAIGDPADGSGGEASATRLTHGWRDFAPQIGASWSGLLRAEKKAAPQLFVGRSLETAHRITDNHLGVAAFALDDTGDRALYVARVGEAGRYGEDASIPANEEAPRRITSAAYLSNGLGYTNDRPARAFLVDLIEPGLGKAGITGADEVPRSTMLAGPDSDVHDPQFSPSGQRISVIASVVPDHGTPDLRSTVWLLGGEAPTPVALPALSVGLHRWIDDDTLLLIAGDLVEDELDFVAQMSGLYVHTLSTGLTRRLTDPETVAVAPDAPVLVTAADSTSSALVAIETDGAVRLALVPLDAEALVLGELVWATDETSVVTGFSVDGETIVYTAVTPTSTAVLARTSLPGTSVAADAQGDAVVTLKEHPAPVDSVLPEVLHVEGAGGTITGWLAVPAGEGPFPVVLNIHGGPFAQYTHGWFDETQVLTSAGYAVVYSNPRGSGGRTRTWGKAVQGDMAAPAMADVFAVLEHALATHPELDATRLGVQGGSYGGFLTAMITSHDDRFRAAIVERGYLDPDSFVGTSDIGRFFTEGYTTRDREAIVRQSPLANAAKVSTPSLIMHSELDFRCPLEQAQQYYAALQRAGVETEMLIFPGENHELSRSGQPRHRRQRFDAVLDWWETHLGAR